MPLTEAFTNFQITQRVTGGARLAVNGNVTLPGVRASPGTEDKAADSPGIRLM